MWYVGIMISEPVCFKKEKKREEERGLQDWSCLMSYHFKAGFSNR